MRERKPDLFSMVWPGWPKRNPEIWRSRSIYPPEVSLLLTWVEAASAPCRHTDWFTLSWHTLRIYLLEISLEIGAFWKYKSIYPWYWMDKNWMGLWHPVIHYAMLRTKKWSRISLWHGAIGHRFGYRSRRGQWQRGTFGWTTSKTRVTTLELRYSLASGTHPGLKKGRISNKCDLDPFNRLAASSHSEPRLLWLPTELEESKILTWGT